ncbi:neuferricin [Tribolium castaneum]|uniref:Neuferricin homolog-like Protein n=1 Tax=Tribolium castaneum TaxID=7070 RepID=D6WVF7_TRICA|nr:PREDICTED: neuferricin [Tribolium castaneum]EFA08561.1 Neuferricin homolog-like Protein [Tribolium castaneum]|eukprot:XP_970460.1 PREDICTED: neuferricin [Tribolium castaneum]
MYIKVLLFSIFVAVIAIIYRSKFVQNADPNLFTAADLRRFNGIDHPNLYLAILGKVFDVSKGSAHYGPGATYNFFVAKDASRSFITGQFTEGQADDRVSDLGPGDLRSLNHWVRFYHKEYKRVGKLIGRYYDETGKLTQYGREVKKLIQKAEREKEFHDEEKLKFPPCNVEWNADTGSRVWCTEKSGGVSRDWVGFPRQLYEPGSQSFRCVCVKSGEVSANLKQYDGCDASSISCFVKS